MSQTGDFRGLVTAWREDVDKALIKERNVSPDTPATHLTKAVKYVNRGRVSRATGLINTNSKGKAPFSEGIKAQVLDKRPQGPDSECEPSEITMSTSASPRRPFGLPAQ